MNNNWEYGISVWGIQTLLYTFVCAMYNSIQKNLNQQKGNWENPGKFREPREVTTVWKKIMNIFKTVDSGEKRVSIRWIYEKRDALRNL